MQQFSEVSHHRAAEVSTRSLLHPSQCGVHALIILSNSANYDLLLSNDFNYIDENGVPNEVIVD